MWWCVFWYLQHNRDRRLLLLTHGSLLQKGYKLPHQVLRCLGGQKKVLQSAAHRPECLCPRTSTKSNAQKSKAGLIVDSLLHHTLKQILSIWRGEKASHEEKPRTVVEWRGWNSSESQNRGPCNGGKIWGGHQPSQHFSTPVLRQCHRGSSRGRRWVSFHSLR